MNESTGYTDSDSFVLILVHMIDDHMTLSDPVEELCLFASKETSERCVFSLIPSIFVLWLHSQLLPLSLICFLFHSSFLLSKYFPLALVSLLDPCSCVILSSMFHNLQITHYHSFHKKFGTKCSCNRLNKIAYLDSI
ncbi:hypothetical protein XENOCAPTIV_023176 [Xenoophorus captivus]|uniref:Uncharacterized protein n=1 Tax=Xenoophorus captivus TaxID=1517983 RepID=A0ABV0QE47_9TELE